MKKYFLFFLCLLCTVFLFPKQIFSFNLDENIFNYSKVTDSNIQENSQPIIWIQDLHKDYTVQNNIYNILLILSSNKDLDNIYLEGVDSNKTLDTSLLSSIPNEKIRKQTIQNLFENGVLSAGEYFSLNTNKKVYGIENAKIYSQNLKIFEKINENKELNSYITGKICDFVKNLKDTYILSSISDVQNKDINTLDLNDNFPNLRKQQDILNNSNKIKYSDIKTEFNMLLEDLKSKISVNEYKILSDYLKTNNSYGYSKFYEYVKNDLEKYPQLNLFLKSNSEMFSINPIQLLKETEEIKKELLESLDLNVSETEILALEYYSEALSNLVKATISADQYQQIKKHKDYVSYICRKYLPVNLSKFAVMYLSDEDFFTFYDNNFERNKIFVQNILKSNDNKCEVLIAGGFHYGMIDELKKQNKSYIILTPNVSTNKSAFNQLFTAKFNEGLTNETDVLTEIIKSWGVFFSNADTFQNEINGWIENCPQLKDKQYEISVSLNLDKTYNVEIKSKESGKTVEVNDILSSHSQQKEPTKRNLKTNKQFLDLAKEKIFKSANETKWFGKNTRIIVSKDSSLIDSSFVLPISIKEEKDGYIITINKTFLETVSIENDDIIETIIPLLFMVNYKNNSAEFAKFISENSAQISRLCEIKKELEQQKTVTQRIKTLISKIFKFNKSNVSLISVDDYSSVKNEDEINMIEALKQAELARQNRSFLKSFVQPPIGGYIVDKNGIKGRNYNRIDSLLHAETLTIIDYFRNYININKESISDETYKKINYLLDCLIANANSIDSKLFYSDLSILQSIGINIDYNEEEKRDVKKIFEETNAVLSWINNSLGNPLSDCRLYCTLAPCNKCAKTMEVLKIDSLVYASSSKNIKHKNSDLLSQLRKANIDVTENVLDNIADRYIRPYSILNSSKVGTNISSLIQSIMRFIINKSTSKMYKVRDAFIFAQDQISWNHINGQSDLSSFENLLKMLKINYDDTELASLQVAAVVDVLENKMEPFVEKGNIYFRNQEGKNKMYIDSKFKIVMTKDYKEYLEFLKNTTIYTTDVDDTIAVRESPFEGNIIYYINYNTINGIGQPILITGNTRDNIVGIRLKNINNLEDSNGLVTYLSKFAYKLFNKMYTYESARQEIKNENKFILLTKYLTKFAYKFFSRIYLYLSSKHEGKFVSDVDYSKDKKTILEKEVLEQLDKELGTAKQTFISQFRVFKECIRILQGGIAYSEKINYEDIVTGYVNEVVKRRNKDVNYDLLIADSARIDTDNTMETKMKAIFGEELLTILGYSSYSDLMDAWKTLSNEEIKKEKNKLFEYIRDARINGISEDVVLRICSSIAVFEMARLYKMKSQSGVSKEDKREIKSLISGITKEGEPLTNDWKGEWDNKEAVVRWKMQIRPDLSRRLVELYYKDTIEKEFEGKINGTDSLVFKRAGSTTIDIQNRDISKGIAISHYIHKVMRYGAGAECVAFTGDDFKPGGVDRAAATKSLKKYPDMLVIDVGPVEYTDAKGNVQDLHNDEEFKKLNLKIVFLQDYCMESEDFLYMQTNIIRRMRHHFAMGIKDERDNKPVMQQIKEIFFSGDLETIESFKTKNPDKVAGKTQSEIEEMVRKANMDIINRKIFDEDRDSVLVENLINEAEEYEKTQNENLLKVA